MKRELLSSNPRLVSEWHPIKNGVLTPTDVTAGSGKKVWWICERGHEWEAIIANRSKGISCPYCSGKLATNDNCLQTQRPELVKQWHPIKNKKLSPFNVTVGSDKKVWWICEKKHEWEESVYNRAKRKNCPYCSGKRVDKNNSLQAVNPELSKQWHPTKNGLLTPCDVRLSSHKKVWWKCERGHEWEAVIASRRNNKGIGRGSGCPYCSSKKVCIDNSLQTTNPELSKQWHPTKNGLLTPCDVFAKSRKKVWWLCERGHEWESHIYSRNSGIGCPYCSGRKVCDENSLLTLNPELSKQWHPTKNGNLKPCDVTVGSEKKVWWQCDKGHEWMAHIYSRNSGNNCPYCNSVSQTSFPEQAIYYYISKVFNDAINRYKLHRKWEIDIYIPHLKLGIEYDGIYFHKSKNATDIKKEKYINNENIHLLRIKEVYGRVINSYRKGNTIFCNRNPSSQQLHEIINICLNYISENITYNTYIIDIDVDRDKIKINDAFICNEVNNSLQNVNPELSKQWHPIKNLNLKPYMIKPNSVSKVWWLCEKGHEYEASPNNRTNGVGCPYCAGKRACSDNNLQENYINLSNQWHPTKNGLLKPADVTTRSAKKVWWLCSKGHEWVDSVAHRTSGRGCPYCSGRRVSDDNCLFKLNPELSKQWHQLKNGDLTPNDVTLGSSKKVWWQCNKGHEWEAKIINRTNGTGCPHCYKIKRLSTSK